MQGQKRIGILTAGGDCPGLNAAIVEAVAQANRRNIQVVGVKEGWRGLYENNVEDPLLLEKIQGEFDKAGSLLRCSGFDPWRSPDDVQTMFSHYNDLGLTGLIVIGGDSSLKISVRAWKELGIPVAFIPKTIDNDVPGIKYAIGFWTAVERVCEDVAGMRTSAEAQHRVFVLEAMGRDSGWLALYGGKTGGADVIIIPEVSFSFEKLFSYLREQNNRKRASIVVVAEGLKNYFLELIRNSNPIASKLSEVTIRKILADAEEAESYADSFGLTSKDGFASTILSRLIQAHVGLEAKPQNIGRRQRGGNASMYDIHLAQKLATRAVSAITDSHAQGGVYITNTTQGAKAIPLDKVEGMQKVSPSEWLGVRAIETVRE